MEVRLRSATNIYVGRPDSGWNGLSDHRLFDMAFGLLLLVLAAPIMLLVAASIWIEDGGSIFFVQERIGRGGRVFPCLKFRSMALNAEHHIDKVLERDPVARQEWALNRKLRCDPRVTMVGRLIRRGSLDELPQLFNVLLGDMGLVGPRPIMTNEVSLYGSRLSYYCTVRPGLTGLWQISGRSHASFRSRIAMDMVYIRSRRIAFDLRILVATIPVVLFGRGSY